MVIPNDYTLLSTTVRLANSTNLSHFARLKAISRFIKKSFDADTVNIFIYDPDRRTLSRGISSNGPERFFSCSVPLGEGIAGACVQNRELFAGDSGLLHPDEPASQGPVRVLAFPLICGKRVMGAASLTFAGESLSQDVPARALRDIMTEVAGLVSSVEVAERFDRRIQSLITLDELDKALRGQVPFSELLPFVLKTAHEYTSSSCTILRIFHYDVFNSKVLKACQRKHRGHLATMLDMEKECSARLLRTGTPILAIDVIGDEDLPPSYICVPLHFDNRTFGALTFFGKTDRVAGRCNFDEEDRELFEGMANLISSTLSQVRNYRRMAILTQENTSKLTKLSLLYRVSNAMHSTTRINRLIHLSIVALLSGTPPLFERAMLFLVNKRSGMMQGMFGVTIGENDAMMPSEPGEDPLYARWSLSDEHMERLENSSFCRLVKGTRVPLDMSRDIMLRTVQEKKLILADHMSRKQVAAADFFGKYNLRSFVTVPIVAKKETIAVMIIDNPVTGKSVTRDDLGLLQLFANQAGMAIENAMLYNRIEDSNREYGEIRERLLRGERLAALGETAASLAHELKGPLVSIGGLARRLLRKEPPGSTDWKYVDTIVREANRLEKMLAEILVFTRRATICYTQCLIGTVVEESLAVVSGVLEEKRIRLKKRLSSEPLRILGDFQQIKQVCINLFNNAAEAMKPGGVLSVSVAPASLEGRDAVSIKVHDTGGGIPPDILPNIFNPFYTTKDGGSGLGLPIIHRIVTNHGGRVLVSNRGGTGAEFRVIIPAHPIYPHFPSFQEDEFPV